MNELLVNLLLTSIFIITYEILLIHFVSQKRYKTSSLHVFGLVLFAYSILASFYTAPISPTTGLYTSFFKKQLQLIPFKGFLSIFSIHNAESIFFYIVHNLFLLFPLGFFLPLLWRSYRNWLRVTLYGFLVSLTIECTQLLLNAKTDINDIILNVIGVFIGFLIYALLQTVLPELTAVTYVKRSRISKPIFLFTQEPTIMVAAVYIILVTTGLVIAL